jgi:hypothetical protein
MPNRVVAIGDIHGDFSSLYLCLLGAAIIDINGRWIAGNTYVVQTGDIFDDCRYDFSNGRCVNAGFVGDEISSLGFLCDLHQQALQHGGRIFICLGNHEWWAFTGDRMSQYYMTPNSNVYKFSNNKTRYNALTPGSELCKKLACIYMVGVVIGDYVFVHGGLNVRNIDRLDKLDNYNQYLRRRLSEGLVDQTYDNLFSASNGILWDRSSSINDYEPDDSNVCKNMEYLKKKLHRPNLKMVIGHTTHDTITGVCDAIYRIDTAMSHAFGKKEHLLERLHVLDITVDGAFTITINRNLTTNRVRVLFPKKMEDLINSFPYKTQPLL